MKMKITVAGNRKEYTEGLTVADLIQYEHVEMPEYVTASVNDEFLRSGTFGEVVLKDGDSVEFLYFMGGGR
jgi:sulfur carrier protein